jgi:hypothetical protein
MSYRQFGTNKLTIAIRVFLFKFTLDSKQNE